MKKKLEADLVSIAHRVLQLKNKSDINQLYLETQKLYEKLALLRFVNEHFGDIKPTIGLESIEQKIETFFESTEIKPTLVENSNKNKIAEIVSTPQVDFEAVRQKARIEIDKNVYEKFEEIALSNDVNEEVKTLFIPDFDLEPEDKDSKPKALEISLQELVGGDYNVDFFVKVDNNAEQTLLKEETKNELGNTAPLANLDELELPIPIRESKSEMINQKLSKGIGIDLNDRIAFTKHLFGNNPADYNRVLNQLMTFDTFDEIQNFIKDLVKPDYNNWVGKEEYEIRFMEIIEKKFF